MTAEELLDEIRADYPNVLTISDGKDAKVIRIIKKSVRILYYPLYKLIKD